MQALLIGVLTLKFGSFGKHQARSALRLFCPNIGTKDLIECLQWWLVPRFWIAPIHYVLMSPVPADLRSTLSRNLNLQLRHLVHQPSRSLHVPLLRFGFLQLVCISPRVLLFCLAGSSG